MYYFNSISLGPFLTLLSVFLMNSVALMLDSSIDQAGLTCTKSMFLLPFSSFLFENLQVGVVSDDKLFDLLEIAMSSDNAETVKRSRELLDSGVDPIALMSQLAGLIVDIIAGTYELTNLQIHDTALGKRSCE